jgi:hypothetical protein
VHAPIYGAFDPNAEGEYSFILAAYSSGSGSGETPRPLSSSGLKSWITLAFLGAVGDAGKDVICPTITS